MGEGQVWAEWPGIRCNVRNQPDIAQTRGSRGKRFGDSFEWLGTSQGAKPAQSGDQNLPEPTASNVIVDDLSRRGTPGTPGETVQYADSS